MDMSLCADVLYVFWRLPYPCIEHPLTPSVLRVCALLSHNNVLALGSPHGRIKGSRKSRLEDKIR
jgi:hypothetical protein